MAKRFTTAARKWAYAYLVQRDGEKCHLPDCPKAPPQFRLDIDHIDGDESNGDPVNLRLLCITHNRALGAKQAHENRKARKSARRARAEQRAKPSADAVSHLHIPTREQCYQVPDGPKRSPTDSISDVHHEAGLGARGDPPAGRPPRISSRPAGDPAHDATTARRADIDYSRGPAQMQANGIYETAFRMWVNTCLNSRAEVEMSELQYGGAEAVGCSPQTAREYLLKLTSSPGPLERFRVGNSWGVRRKP